MLFASRNNRFKNTEYQHFAFINIRSTFQLSIPFLAIRTPQLTIKLEILVFQVGQSELGKTVEIYSALVGRNVAVGLTLLGDRALQHASINSYKIKFFFNYKRMV
jgi:hypothetical protein